MNFPVCPSTESATDAQRGGQERNHAAARFYDRVYALYPLVDLFCAPGRRRLIEKINRYPVGRLLEVGVGPGRQLGLYLQHQVAAIDCSPRMVAGCRRRFPSMDIRQMDGENLNFPDESFDYVTLFHVMSVTADPGQMLREVHRVLRPGGRSFVLNHETPSHRWRNVDRMLIPLARQLHFRSWFRLEEVPGIDRFRVKPLEVGGVFGLMRAHLLEK